MGIRFQIFEKRHLELLRRWLQQEHIKPIWQETDSEAELEKKFLHEMPSRYVYGFIIEYQNIPIGFIQYYDAARVGGGWWADESAGTFGIDLMIGEAEYLGKGLGADVIQQFVALIQERETGISSFIIDPDPKNTRAIRAFQKAGFTIENEIKTPGGDAVLMRRK